MNETEAAILDMELDNSHVLSQMGLRQEGVSWKSGH